MFLDSPGKLEEAASVPHLFLQDRVDTVLEVCLKEFESKQGPGLSEAYYGKNPLLQEAERIIGEIGEQIADNPKIATQISCAKEIRRLSDIFCELFNFEDFYFIWDSQTIQGNAYTFPVTYNLFVTDYAIVKGKHGMQYKNAKGKRPYLYINNALFLLDGMTPGMIMAVILHEIGHNFYASKRLIHFGKYFLVLYEIYTLIDYATKKMALAKGEGEDMAKLAILVTVLYHNSAAQRLRMWLKSKNELAAAASYVMSIFKDVLNIVNAVVILISSLMFLPKLRSFIGSVAMMSGDLIKKNAVKLLVTLSADGYRNEKFADNFATSYGYGMEMVQGAKLMGAGSNFNVILDATKEIPIVSHLTSLFVLVNQTLASFFDEHPKNALRISDQADKLRADLEKHGDLYSAETKAEMLETIQKIEEIGVGSEEGKKKTNFFQFLQDIVRKKILGVDDARELIAKTKDYDHDGLMVQ